MTFRAVALCALIATAAACSVGPPGSGIDAARAVGHAQALAALGPRPGDSEAARNAASYLTSQLEAMGLHAEAMPVGTVEVPAREVAGVIHRPARNGFVPDGLPFAVWVTAFVLAPVAALAWWLRKRPTPGPLGTLVLPVGSGLAMAAGVIAVLHARPPCNAAEFRAFHLACEAVAKVR